MLQVVLLVLPHPIMYEPVTSIVVSVALPVVVANHDSRIGSSSQGFPLPLPKWTAQDGSAYHMGAYAMYPYQRKGRRHETFSHR